MKYTIVAIIHHGYGPNIAHTEVRQGDYTSPAEAATDTHDTLTTRQANLGAYDCTDDCDGGDATGDHSDLCHAKMDTSPEVEITHVIEMTTRNVHYFQGVDYHLHDCSKARCTG